MSNRAALLVGLLTLLSVILRNQLLFLVSIFLWLVIGVAYLWARYCLVNLTYRRHLSSNRLYLNEEADLQMEIVNAKPLPLPWLRIDDLMPLSINVASQMVTEEEDGQHRRLVTVLGLRWYERVVRRYRVRGLHRGLWHFGPAQIRSGDIFGFDIRRMIDETPTELLVYPRIVPVTALGLPARHPLGDQQSPRRVIEDPLRIMGVRDYVQGDNFRHIHWKASARTLNLQTKVFDPSAGKPVAIFLNVSTARSFSEGFDWNLREYGITAAASLARQLWLESYIIGLFANTALPGRLQHIRIRPRRHPEQLEQILAALARIDDIRGRWPLERILQIEAPSLPYGATIVIISAILTPELEQTLLDLRRREYAVVLLTVGERGPGTYLPNIHHQHLGGLEEWFALETMTIDAGDLRARPAMARVAEMVSPMRSNATSPKGRISV
ncbi:MAG: DUF58 domain-containing protein [Caldilineaceae bacterium]|nr:DUF58 domain-containing protein [Caldilineaceae bacterium]